MNASRSCFAFVLIGLLAACATAPEVKEQRLGTAVLNDSSGAPVGSAQLVSVGSTLRLSVAVTGIAPGPHGFHLHAIGECKVSDFKSAGGHLNPLNKQHGSMNPQGTHLGDLSNLEVGASGTGSASYDLSGDREQVLEWLFDPDGTALVLHAAADDYLSDPAGNAGSRIACGVLKPA